MGVRANGHMYIHTAPLYISIMYATTTAAGGQRAPGGRRRGGHPGGRRTGTGGHPGGRYSVVQNLWAYINQ
jgi:hypothetical protein